MTKRRAHATAWQKRCLHELRAASHLRPELIRSVAPEHFDRETSVLSVRFTIRTSAFPRTRGGLPLRPVEDLVLAIEASGERPPHVLVDHFRFLGHPHVLSGYYLCLYLDPSREWDANYGLTSHPNGVLNRLWRWLERGSANQFDANEALYHAVGGLPQIGRRPSPLPPIVVRSLPTRDSRVASSWLAPRSDWCLELHPTPLSDATRATTHAPVFFTDRDLPFGVGRAGLQDLLERLDFDSNRIAAKIGLGEGSAASFGPRGERLNCLQQQGPLGGVTARPRYDPSQSSTFLAILCASARRKPTGHGQQFVLGVPHPKGGPVHLLAAHLDSDSGDLLRELDHRARKEGREISPRDIPPGLEVMWTHVSDERPAINTRRDHARPTARFFESTVVMLGLGGLGSWIAELIVRAGAKRIVLCDPGMVSGGLLVRQTYEDSDIGSRKSDRLAERLRRIAPDLTVDVWDALEEEELRDTLRFADLVVDATVSKTVARTVSGVLLQESGRRAVVAQVAVDARSGSLGMVMIHGRELNHDALDQDRIAGAVVLADPQLEPYGIFWIDPEANDEFVPTRGCSIPTFHGSAADMAGVASTMTTLIASHLGDDASGTHLFAMPHTGVNPAHHYLRSRPPV
ncbi:ThiF family adenylyltransferase [Microbacterium sp. W4I20]|uniref:ThiF family adenylyltransferase n=1 Tax=Microbacterium sp. W4I20 TaxID=3042262 RepID=UPI0027D7A47F|nr:ThiF family adenylyltransferase [Microbacterium sp. W4I20]